MGAVFDDFGHFNGGRRKNRLSTRVSPSGECRGLVDRYTGVPELVPHRASLRDDRLSDSPVTRATLLLRLRDAKDNEAWSEFLTNYGPMLYRFVRSRGLQDADASDVVQDVLRRVGNAIGRLEYDSAKGGFRAWLFTITRNRLATFFEKRQRIGPTGNDTGQLELLAQAADDRNELVDQWELEHLRALAAIAMKTVEANSDPKTWSAFRITAIEGRAASDAAEELSMTSGAVYVARSRITAKLRSEIERLESEEDV